jgi:hypothetical protein
MVSLISVTIFGGWIFAVITVLLFVAMYKPVNSMRFLPYWI